MTFNPRSVACSGGFILLLQTCVEVRDAQIADS